MRTTQRTNAIGIVQQLLDKPYRFEFFQAISLIEKLLVDKGIPQAAVLSDYLQFRNSTGQGFPASQIETLELETSKPAIACNEEVLLDALERGELERICITPAFFGLLGNHGVMPSHYGERIESHQYAHKNSGGRAYFDIFSTRLVALFYRAWRKNRLELARVDSGKAVLMPIMLALAGSKVHTVPDTVVAYYASAFAQRPVTAVMIERVLSDYFKVSVKVQPNIGRWQQLDVRHETQLGFANATLNAGATLGQRIWRRDLTVGIRIGPLNKAQYEDFLWTGKGAEALRNMLAMFDTPTLRYEVRLVLQAGAVSGTTLTADSKGKAAQLGVDAFMLAGPAPRDRDDTHYVI